MIKIKGTAIDAQILIFAALAIFSTFFSIYKHDSFYSLAELFCYIGLYYLIVNGFDRLMIKRLLYAIVGMGVLLSSFGILQYLDLFGHSWWDPGEFIASTFVNHNHFSGYLELVLPVTIVFIIKRSPLRRLLMTVALVVMAAAFILAQSRGAWLSLGVSLLVMVSILVKTWSDGSKRVIIVALLAVAIISLAYFGRDVITERISGSISAESPGDSFASRLKIWRGAVDMIRDNPLIGTGIGSFVWGFPRYRPEGLNGLVNFAHNDYLETACDMGIPALIVMVWLLTIVIKKGMAVKSLSSVRFGCAVGILSLSIHALSDFNFHIPANMLLFTVYIGIVMREEK